MYRLKRASAGLLAAFFVAVGLLTVLPPKSAHADNLDLDTICIPQHDNNLFVRNGSITVQVINRAMVYVKVNPSVNCEKPSGLLAENFSESRVKWEQIKPYEPGKGFPMVDQNTSDEPMQYLAGDKEDGGAFRSYGANSPVLDQFSGKLDDLFRTNDKTGGADGIVNTSASSFTSALGTPEVGFVLDGDDVGKDCTDGDIGGDDSDSHFKLDNGGSDGKFNWRCDENEGHSKTGLKLRASDFIDLDKFNITYNVVDEGDDQIKVEHVAIDIRGSRTFTYCGSGKFISEECSGDLELDASLNQLRANPEGVSDHYIYKLDDNGNRKQNDRVQVRIAHSQSESAAATNIGDIARGEEGDGSGTASDIDCEVRILNPLTWLICPIIESANQMVNQLDRAIVSELNVDEDNYFDTTNDIGQRFYGVWSNFRNIALVLLVLAILAMVVMQAFDAATIKKLLPRILVAIIFMTLSWDIAKFLMAITNEVGAAVRGIIQSPFGGLEDPKITQDVATTAGSGLVVAGFAFGLIGMLSFAGTAALAVLVAFFVLTIRKMAIVFLVLIAPVAIIMYILPNTQKLYKLWWETFSKALWMFPIVMGFIAIGKVFAKVAGASADSGALGLFDHLIVFIGYFGPYFALPTAFKMAGGAIATISGMANDRSRGVFNRLSKFRQGRAGDRIKKFRHGGLYDETNRRRKLYNQFGSWVFNPDEKVPHFLGHKTGGRLFKDTYERLDAEVRHAQETETREFAQKINERGGNDQTARVMSGTVRIGDEDDGGFSASVHDELWKQFGKIDANGDLVWGGLNTAEDWDKAAEIMGRSDRVSERHAGDALRALKADALNLHREGKGYTDVAAAAGLIVASHGFMNEDDLVTLGRSIENRTGSQAYANTMMTMMEVNGKNSGLKVTYSHARDAKGRIISGTEAGRDWDRALSKSYQDVATQKRHAVETDVESYEEIIMYANMTTTERQRMVQRWRSEGMSEDQIRARNTDVEIKAAAAADTLQKIMVYNPGAADTLAVVEKAYKNLEDLGIQVDPRKAREKKGGDDDTPVDPGAITPSSGGGSGGGFAAPPTSGAPPVAGAGGGFAAPGI